MDLLITDKNVDCPISNVKLSINLCKKSCTYYKGTEQDESDHNYLKCIFK